MAGHGGGFFVEPFQGSDLLGPTQGGAPLRVACPGLWDRTPLGFPRRGTNGGFPPPSPRTSSSHHEVTFAPAPNQPPELHLKCRPRLGFLLGNQVRIAVKKAIPALRLILRRSHALVLGLDLEAALQAS